jgi:hypothetical protein
MLLGVCHRVKSTHVVNQLGWDTEYLIETGAPATITTNGSQVPLFPSLTLVLSIQVRAMMVVTGDRWSPCDLVAAPEPRCLSEAVLAELAVIEVYVIETLDHRSCPEQAVAWILYPPQARLQMTDDVEGLCH